MLIDITLKGQQPFFEQHWLRWLSIGVGVGVVLHWILVGWLINSLHTTLIVPLHYTIYFGIDWLGHWRWLLLWPLIATGSGIVNGVLAKMLLGRAPLLSYMLMVGAMLGVCISLSIFASIAYINL
jgi:hypothetical protein